ASLTLLTLIYWSLNSNHTSPSYGGASKPLRQRRRTIWRSSVAWRLSIYMGAQASVFYLCLTWLPAVEQHLGYSGATSGWHMLGLEITGVVGNLIAPYLRSEERRVGRGSRSRESTS